MNVIIYGKPDGIFGVEELLKAITSVKNVSVLESIESVQGYQTLQDAGMILIDADNETTDWQFLARKFKEINNQVEIVLLSSRIDQSVRAYEAGVFDYVLKPVKKKQLERVMAKAGYK